MKFGDGIDWDAEARRAAKEGMPGAKPGEMVALIMEALGEKRGKLVDCGCNIARFCPEVRAAGFEYIGVDQALEALTIAKSRYPEVKFVRSMLWDAWPGLAGQAVAAICNAVLQHNTHDEKRRILARVAEAVEPGGVFAMQESTVVAETKTQLRQGDWVKLVEGFGFELKKLWHPNQEFGVYDGYLFVRRA